jgi:hypothetical protein
MSIRWSVSGIGPSKSWSNDRQDFRSEKKVGKKFPFSIFWHYSVSNSKGASIIHPLILSKTCSEMNFGTLKSVTNAIVADRNSDKCHNHRSPQKYDFSGKIESRWHSQNAFSSPFCCIKILIFSFSQYQDCHHQLEAREISKRYCFFAICARNESMKCFGHKKLPNHLPFEQIGEMMWFDTSLGRQTSKNRTIMMFLTEFLPHCPISLLIKRFLF